MGERVDTDRRGPSQLHPFEGGLRDAVRQVFSLALINTDLAKLGGRFWRPQLDMKLSRTQSGLPSASRYDPFPNGVRQNDRRVVITQKCSNARTVDRRASRARLGVVSFTNTTAKAQ